VNQGTANHWLEVRVFGDGDAINWSAVGAQVRVKVGDLTLTRQVEAGTGQGNQNDLVTHFGLGANAGPVAVEVTWPGGRTERLQGVAVDRVIAVGAAKAG